MDKTKACIGAELLILLGIRPEEGIKYLESKKAVELDPVHVRAHQNLKQQTVPSS